MTGRGDWMQTYTGRAFYPLQPDPNHVDPLDIAHALGMLCRYGGHTKHFYSVAEHCVLMSRAVDDEYQVEALLHDATETYVGDVIRPLKRSLPAYQAIEDRVARAIATRFGRPTHRMSDAVREADNRILLDERRIVLGPSPQRWHASIEDLKPLGVQPRLWSPHQARDEYLLRMTELRIT